MSCRKSAVAYGCWGYSMVELLIGMAILVTICAIAIPSYMEMVNSARVTKAIGDIQQLQMQINRYRTNSEDYPESLAAARLGDRLDPWGQPYQYLKIADKKKGKGHVEGARKDKNLHPLNSDYDLYSVGCDGLSKLPLPAKESQDDIVRANDGGFIGLASNY